MERRNLALLCAGVLCFWLFALAVGTAQGAGLRVAIGETGPAVQADAPAVLAAAPANSGLQLECRAAILMEPETGRVLYEKAPDERMPIASITKLMTLLLTFEAIRGGKLTLDTPVPVSEHAYHMGGITGLKTGTTSGAGVCISASATRDGLTLIAVVLGSPSSADRFHSATTLLDYGFANYAAAPLPTLPERPLALAVKGSAEDSVPLDYAALPETILIEKGTASALRAELTLPEALEAPVEKGQTVGKVSIFQDDTLLNEYEVKAAADAPLLTFGGALELLWQCLLGV